MGGGAASSRVQQQHEQEASAATTAASTAELDFNAVQRGDAEMENRMNRVIRACVELGDRNPIISIHDQVGVKLRAKQKMFCFVSLIMQFLTAYAHRELEVTAMC